jgi:O-antigen ligase
MLAIAASLHEIVIIWARAARAVMVVAGIAALMAFRGQPLSSGPFISKNHLGFAVASCAIPLVAWTWHRNRFRAVGWMVLAVALSALVNSQTGVLLSLAVPSSYALAGAAKRRRFDRRSMVVLLFGLLALTVAALNADRLLEAGTSAVGRTTDLSGRDIIWPVVVRAAEQRPWLGTGLGGVWLRPEAEPTASIVRSLPFSIRDAAVYAHNGFLDVWLQMGLIGLAIFVAVVLSAARRAVSILRMTAGVLAALPIVAVVVAVFGNLTESRFYNDNAWLMLAMVASLSVQTLSSRVTRGNTFLAAGGRTTDPISEASEP